MAKLSLSARLRDLPREEFRARLRAELEGKIMQPVFQSVNIYLVSPQGPELLEFVKQAFGAEEVLRTVGSAGGMHAEAMLGGVKLMIGGGAPARTCAMHLYVPAVDAAYRSAIAAGATSLSEPADMPYGERGAGVKDLAGNMWYLATGFGDHYVQTGCDPLMPYFHATGADAMILLFERAFGATLIDRHANPDGSVAHAKMRLGASVIELSDARGPYQPMPATFNAQVGNTDAAFQRAVDAGCSVLQTPVDRPHGRSAGVTDPFGNQWYFLAPIVAPGQETTA